MPVTDNLGCVPCVERPDHPAILAPDTGGAWRVITNTALDTEADAVARGLRERGLQPGERIAIVATNSPEYMATVLGAMRAGVVPVPLNFRFPANTLDALVADCGAGLVFCDGERDTLLRTPQPRVRYESHGEHSYPAFLRPGPFTAVSPASEQAALMLYTSGSSGLPKGVLLSHGGQLWTVRTRLGDNPDVARHRYLVAAPLYHMNALALLFLILAGGATCVLLPKFDAAEYIDAIARWRCTWLTAVPPMMAMLLQQDGLDSEDLSSVQVIRMGSAPVSPRLLQDLRRLWPDAWIINAYGTTESGPVAFLPPGPGEESPDGSLGRAHPAVALRLVDAESQERAEGELQVRSPALMLGYQHAGGAIERPFTADGYYPTGDVLRRDASGWYFFVGRTDDMFVSGGENIFPSEVERVLEQHPGVHQACVIPVEDAIKGHKPVAYIVRTAGNSVSEEEIREFALRHAPAFQHPRRVWFIDALPLAGSNKVDRAQLRVDAKQRIVEPLLGNRITPAGDDAVRDPSPGSAESCG